MSNIRSFSHKFNKLVSASIKQGLAISEQYKETLARIHKHQMNLNTRYLKTGYRGDYPTIESLEVLCTHLRASLKKQLVGAGHSVS